MPKAMKSYSFKGLSAAPIIFLALENCGLVNLDEGALPLW